MKKYSFWKRENSLLFFLLFLFSSSAVFSQTFEKQEIGSPPLENFAPNQYNAGPEIRSIIKSSRGFIYAASNSRDILEYDGTNWKKIFTPCNYVYTMEEDANGNIHIADGLQSCVGYLRPESTTGKWEFIPLRPENIADSVWNQPFISAVMKRGNDIYYTIAGQSKELGNNITFKFENGKLKEAFRIDREDIQKTFITQKGIFYSNGEQLFHKKIIDNSISTDTSYDSLKNSSFFADKHIYKIYDYSEDELLIYGIISGVFIYNLKTHQITTFGNEESQRIFKDAQILSARKINQGSWIFGSIKTGIIQTNNQGQIIRTISTKEGLIGNIIMNFTQDNQNQIWTALYSGISKVNIETPLEYWGEEKGILGKGIYDIIRYQNTIFAGTITNVVVLGKDGNWKPLEGTPIENRVFSKLTLEDGKEHLFLGAINGLYEIIKDQNQEWKLVPIYIAKEIIRTRFIANTKAHPNRLYLDNLAGGFGYIEYGKENKTMKSIKFLENTPLSVMLSQNDKMWAIRNDSTIISIDIENEKIVSYSKPTSWIANNKGEINIFQFGTDSIFKVEQNESLSINQELTTLLKDYAFNGYIQVQSVGTNTLWVYNPQDFFLHIYTKTGKEYKRNTKLEQTIGKYFVRNLYEDENNPNIVWIGTSAGILRVDLTSPQTDKSNEDIAFSAFIRSVKIGSDSVIFEGNFFSTSKFEDSTVYKISDKQLEKDIISIENKYNSISFKVTSLFFAEENRTQYSYFLEGLDEKWSDWTNLPVKEYNNLREGKYTFRAKARNYLGQESTETTYQFIVLPPWHRTTTAYILYVIFGVGIIFSSARFYTHRLRKQNEHLENLVSERTDELYQKNAELSTQNEEIVQQRDQLDFKNQQIAEQNKNIVASINYAKRIQTALLPMEKRIKQEIPEHFIFYKPRDIVSGDFYWIEKAGEKVIIAVADCTGHGVPGAFMSMLGTSGLADAVFQQKLTQPDLILTHLHNYIFAALKQNQSDNRDGMDMCIIVWDKEANQIQYAGAMNPLYYVQNEEFFTIKADKIPVGGTVAKERIYTPHTINLHVPTTIYLASDGYQDQFGGTENRKFMTKQFRELLLEISHLPMKEQENRISQVFERWKGENHQIDDVLVMGIKIG